MLIWHTPVIANLISLLVVLAEVALLAGLSWRQTTLIAWSIGLLGVIYGLSLIGQPEVDALSLLVAALLFLTAEAAYLGVEDRVYSGLLPRALASLAVAAGAVVVSLVMLAVGSSVGEAGPALTAGGIVAALVLLGVLVGAATRRARS